MKGASRHDAGGLNIVVRGRTVEAVARGCNWGGGVGVGDGGFILWDRSAMRTDKVFCAWWCNESLEAKCGAGSSSVAERRCWYQRVVSRISIHHSVEELATAWDCRSSQGIWHVAWIAKIARSSVLFLLVVTSHDQVHQPRSRIASWRTTHQSCNWLTFGALSPVDLNTVLCRIHGPIGRNRPSGMISHPQGLF